MRGSAVLAICVGVMLGGSALPARADSLTQLPSTVVAPSMVVDPGGQHVFISGGPGQSSIVVLDFNGNIVKTITGEPGASQMAVDPSTHTLYVALYGANAISAIDTQSLTETSRFSVAPLVQPQSLVIAGGQLWFSDLTGYSHGYVASMNFDGSDVTEREQELLPGVPTALFQSVQLSSGGANNDLLATAQASGGVSLYDVTGGVVTPLNGPLGDPGGSPCSVGDFSVTPSADYVLFISPCEDHAVALATDLQGASFDYPAGYGGADAVASSPDGQYVATGAGNGVESAATIQVFPKNSAQPAWGWAIGVAPHSLAFSPDGMHLFAIVGDNGGLGFQVLDRYTAPDTLLTSGPASGSSTYNTSASFSFSSHNAPATFECQIDGSGWNTCSSPTNVGGLLPGSHTFGVRSVVGSRIDPVGATTTWTVLPPDTKITSGPGTPTYVPNATFAFTSDDTNPLQYMCRLDAQSWQQCFSPMTFTNLAAGSHTFQVKAADGNLSLDADPVGATETWTIAPGGQELDVTTAGVGFGSVSSSPTGINACTAFCSAWYGPGTTVTLTAHPSTGPVYGSKFDGWSGACSGTGRCVVTMSNARAVTATFSHLQKVPLTVVKSGKGAVSSKPAGISCGSTCKHTYVNGTVVTLTATAAPGFVFTGWSGGCTGTSKTCQLSMTSPRTATATFASNELLTVVKAGTGSGLVKSSPAGIACGSTCTHKFAPGTVVTLTATPRSGSTFMGWTGACSGTGSCVVTLSAAKAVKAKFG